METKEELEQQLAELTPALRKLISIIVSADESVVLDLTQDALVRCLTLLGEYNPDKGTLRTFAQMNARCVAMDYMRGRNLPVEKVTDTGDITDHDTVDEQIVAEVDSARDDIIALEEARLIQALHYSLTKLTPEQRVVLNAYYIEDKPDRVIAKEIGISHDGVTQRRHRALNRLRGLLRSYA